MKKIALILILVAALVSRTAHAQTVVYLCVQVPGTGTPKCYPVSPTNPLPVYVPAGH